MQALQYGVILGSSFIPSASFVVQSSTVKCLVQAMYYKVVMGCVLCKLCSTK